MAKIIIGLFVVISQGKLFLSVSMEAIGFLFGFDSIIVRFCKDIHSECRRRQTTSTTRLVIVSVLIVVTNIIVAEEARGLEILSLNISSQIFKSSYHSPSLFI